MDILFYMLAIFGALNILGITFVSIWIWFNRKNEIMDVGNGF